MNSIIHIIGKGLNSICRKSYWFSEVLFPDCAKFWNHNVFNLDVVNLGSTSGLNAFNYEGVDLKCANWAISHNPLAGDEAILKNYMSYLNPQKSTVIFSLCPFSSLSGSYDISEDRYYTLLYASSIPSFSYSKQLRIAHMMNRPLKYYPLYEILKDLGKFIKALIIKKSFRSLSEQEMKADAECWMNSWKHEFGIKSFDEKLSLINVDAIKDSIAIIDRMVEFCKSRNITSVFIIPPVYHTLWELFSSEAKEKVINSLANPLIEKGCHFINYMDNPEISYDSSLFENSFLLNKSGAEKFTRLVLKEIGLI